MDDTKYQETMYEFGILRLINHDSIERFNQTVLVQTKLFCLSSLDESYSIDYLLKNYHSGVNYNAICFCIKKISDALKYLFKSSVVHRCLNSCNVMVNSSLEIKLTGFAFARRIEDPSKVFTKPWAWSLFDFPPHTRDHMLTIAPEILLQVHFSHSQNKNGYDCQSDIFSLGILAAELFMGVNPFDHFHPILAIDKKLRIYNDLKTRQLGII
ncbi:STE20-related kinase adapter protein alpha [Thelohanellus kitauei]|uniref:STE20-related kinase adapter protein alpha n=1 Tax=Thelohanellus kitauei TaxID=669202 RepID=A0A0C2MB49_THEKT|nr:STE20-related kinase adapter protein alpha [Thelohanellus kitauei]